MIVNAFEFKLMNNPLRAFIQEYYEIKPFLPYADKVKGKSVLEIGCGNGFGSSLVKKYFQPKSVTGVDLDPKMIAQAKQNYPQSSFEVGDVTKLNFPNKSFDAVFDFGVIHHVPNWPNALEEIFRVLKPGGYFLAEDFSIESYDGFIGQLAKRFTDHPYKEMYRQKEFVNYFKKLGFKILKYEVRRPLNTMSYFVLVASK